jgi:hypothetical protein
VECARLVIGVRVLCANQKIKLPPAKRSFILTGNSKWICVIEAFFAFAQAVRRFAGLGRIQFLKHGKDQLSPRREAGVHSW